MDKQSLRNRLARAATLTSFALALTVAPLANPGAVAAKGDFYFDFEASVKPWAADGHGTEGYQTLEQGQGDVACIDLVPINHFAILRAGKAEATSGAPGIPLPVGTWMEVAFASAPGSHRVEISFYARSEAGCEGCIPLVYAGGAPPALITQFEAAAGEGNLTSYWQEYRYKSTVDIPDQQSSALYTAIGWSGTDAAIALDCVSVRFMPEP